MILLIVIILGTLSSIYKLHDDEFELCGNSIFAFYLRRIYSPIASVLTSIGNLINWLPIIWNDRDWESDYFIHKILLHKLKSTKKYFESVSITFDHNRDIEYISTCIRLLELIEKGEFTHTTLAEDEYEDKLYNTLYSIIAKRIRHWWD